MTVSLGLSQMKQNDTIETFIERTDTLLYEAKKGGKNQIKADF
jgi:PleD family two-component response regulator